MFSSSQNAVGFYVTTGFSSNGTIRGNLIGTRKTRLANIVGGSTYAGPFLGDLSANTLIADTMISGTTNAVSIRLRCIC